MGESSFQLCEQLSSIVILYLWCGTCKGAKYKGVREYLEWNTGLVMSLGIYQKSLPEINLWQWMHGSYNWGGSMLWLPEEPGLLKLVEVAWVLSRTRSIRRVVRGLLILISSENVSFCVLLASKLFRACPNDPTPTLRPRYPTPGIRRRHFECSWQYSQWWEMSWDLKCP